MASIVSSLFSPSSSTTALLCPDPISSESASLTVRFPLMRGRSPAAPLAGSRSISPTLRQREPLEDAVVADEGGDELGVRVREDVLRGVVLGEDAALLEDGDLVAHLYGLVYVVGDEDDGLLYVLLDAARTRPGAARA